MDCSTPGLPVHHKLLEFTQTHAHRVSDAIQPSHPLSPPSPPALNPSQHQGLSQGTISFSFLKVYSLKRILFKTKETNNCNIKHCGSKELVPRQRANARAGKRELSLELAVRSKAQEDKMLGWGEEEGAEDQEIGQGMVGGREEGGGRGKDRGKEGDPEEKGPWMVRRHSNRGEKCELG